LYGKVRHGAPSSIEACYQLVNRAAPAGSFVTQDRDDAA
jgi:hypothetical protein